jgi:hypothetical protein
MGGKIQQGAGGAGARMWLSGRLNSESDTRLHATGCDHNRPQIRYQEYQWT